MMKRSSIILGLALALGAGAATAQPASSGTSGTGADVVGALIISNNPSVTRGSTGGLANALYRITTRGGNNR